MARDKQAQSTRREWFHQLERLALLVIMLGPCLQALIAPTHAIADDAITINYDTTNGMAPARDHACFKSAWGQ